MVWDTDSNCREFAKAYNNSPIPFSELLYLLQTSRFAIHLTPATCHPEASHANCKVFRYAFSEAEGSAPLNHRAIQD
jgi:hypothetical protein